MAPSSASLLVCILSAIFIVVSGEDPCTTSTILNDKWRSSSYISPDTEPLHCDNIMDPGWYRFENATISNYCVDQFYCGTYSTLWINSADELQTSVQLCQNYEGNCCYWSTMINVQRCPDPNARQGFFYVYQLPQFSSQCYYGICTDMVCPTGQVLTSGHCIDITSAAVQTSVSTTTNFATKLSLTSTQSSTSTTTVLSTITSTTKLPTISTSSQSSTFTSSATKPASDPSIIISTISTSPSSPIIVHNQNPVNLGSIPTTPVSTTNPSTSATTSTSMITSPMNNPRPDSIGALISTPTSPTSTATMRPDKNTVEDTTDQSTVGGPVSISTPTNQQTQNAESVNGMQSPVTFPQWAVIVIVILAGLLLVGVAILIITKCKRNGDNEKASKCLKLDEEFDGKKKTLVDWKVVNGNDYTGDPGPLIGLGQFTLDPRKKSPDVQPLGVESLYEHLDNKLNTTKEGDPYAKLEGFRQHGETDSGIYDTELREYMDQMEANNHIYDDINDVRTDATTDDDDYLKPSRMVANDETVG